MWCGVAATSSSGMSRGAFYGSSPYCGVGWDHVAAGNVEAVTISRADVAGRGAYRSYTAGLSCKFDCNMADSDVSPCGAPRRSYPVRFVITFHGYVYSRAVRGTSVPCSHWVRRGSGYSVAIASHSGWEIFRREGLFRDKGVRNK